MIIPCGVTRCCTECGCHLSLRVYSDNYYSCQHLPLELLELHTTPQRTEYSAAGHARFDDACVMRGNMQASTLVKSASGVLTLRTVQDTFHNATHAVPLDTSQQASRAPCRCMLRGLQSRTRDAHKQSHAQTHTCSRPQHVSTPKQCRMCLHM